jgi:hypothetical protein
MQRPRDKQIYEDRYWVTRFANKILSNGNNVSNVSIATKHLRGTNVLLETMFSTAI